MDIIDYQGPSIFVSSPQLFKCFVFKAVDLNYLKKTEDTFGFFLNVGNCLLCSQLVFLLLSRQYFSLTRIIILIIWKGKLCLAKMLESRLLPWSIFSISYCILLISSASQVALVVTNLLASAGETRDLVPSPSWEDPLDEGVAAHCSIRAWRISWPDETGGWYSLELPSHDRSDLACIAYFSAFFSVMNTTVFPFSI